MNNHRIKIVKCPYGLSICLAASFLLGKGGALGAETPSLQPTAQARNYNFDKTISREELENYLSRSITMEGLFNGRGRP